MSIDSCPTVVELLQKKAMGMHLQWKIKRTVEQQQKKERKQIKNKQRNNIHETVLHGETFVYRICSKVSTPSNKLKSIKTR